MVGARFGPRPGLGLALEPARAWCAARAGRGLSRLAAAVAPCEALLPAPWEACGGPPPPGKPPPLGKPPPPSLLAPPSVPFEPLLELPELEEPSDGSVVVTTSWSPARRPLTICVRLSPLSPTTTC